MIFNKLTLLVLLAGGSVIAAEHRQQQPPRSEDEAKRTAALAQQAAQPTIAASTAQRAGVQNSHTAPSQLSVVGPRVLADAIIMIPCAEHGYHLVRRSNMLPMPQQLALLQLVMQSRQAPAGAGEDGSDQKDE